jgi:predicted GNAT family N-acyltransferase
MFHHYHQLLIWASTHNAENYIMAATANTSTTKSSYKTIQFTQRFEKLVEKRGHRNYQDSRAVSADEARFLARKLRHAIGQIADDDVLLKVLAHNPEVIRMVEREDGSEPGFLAYLPLNEAGVDALRDGHFDRRNPHLDHLTQIGEPVSVLYIWCVYSPGNFIPVISAIAAHFEIIAPSGVPLFTSAATPAAARLFSSLGFSRARDHYPHADDDILVVFRAEPEIVNAAAPALRTTTRVTRTIEDVMKVFSIRAATYMNEQACPYDEEFDGNDFCAAHILGEIDGEPAGCIRIRFFGDFVKIERLAVRPEFRSSTLAFRLVRAAFDYVRTKGFRKAYGHARHDLVNFWARFGFKPIDGRPTFSFSDVDYVEMEADVSASKDVIGIGRSPFELIRPEGQWDVPGPLDRSALRGSKTENLRRRAIST